MTNIYFDALSHLITQALNEDIGTGDITALSTIPETATAHGKYKAKADGVICGLDAVRRVYMALDNTIAIEFFVRDGDRVTKGQVIGEVRGNARTLLSGERVGLNLLQHLSGVATATAQAVAQVEGIDVRIADTRKTTPGMREIEKYAVRVGGGTNHRFGLSDGILIKDNHIVAAGGIANAISAARKNAPHTLKIEIETETMDEVRQSLEAGADIIMLDNMTTEQMSECVKYIDHRALVEASGNMGEKDLREVASTGVDIISIGALTNSVKALDISLKFVIN